MKRRRAAQVVPLLCAGSLALTVPATAAAQWHVGGGWAWIHESQLGGVGAVGASRTVGAERALRLGGILLMGAADDGFVAVQPGVELHLAPDADITPFIAVRAGLLMESEYAGLLMGAAVGAVLRPVPGLGLRMEAGWSTHDGQAGPNVLLLGLELGGTRE